MKWGNGWQNALIGWGLVLLGLGCASSGVPLAEVSEHPIALVYWDEAAARENQESNQRVQADRLSTSGRRGVASLNRMINPDDTAPGSRQGGSTRSRGRIRLLNPRTLELIPFPAAPPDARPVAWSQDGKRLLFNSAHGAGGTPQLYEFNTETAEVRRLTQGPIYHLEGAYASESRFLISWLNTEPAQGQAGLSLGKLNGRGAIELTQDELPMGPRWSPKGDKVLYFLTSVRKTRRDASQVIIQDPEAGSTPRVVARGREPVFTPDGEWIVYASELSEGWRLARVRPDGSGRSVLGNSHLDARWPTVSPDGRHIAYISNTDGIDRLYLRRMDGSGDRILLETGAVAFPVW
ncbi:MAG: TolB family protein [Myxococcota bacterium]|nr:hypothetical protein [Spirochaeta sp.]RPG09033.1 MAG: hypothetical protein CBC32_007640 [Proteobacteria bacterium TMED72]